MTTITAITDVSYDYDRERYTSYTVLGEWDYSPPALYMVKEWAKRYGKRYGVSVQVVVD